MIPRTLSLAIAKNDVLNKIMLGKLESTLPSSWPWLIQIWHTLWRYSALKGSYQSTWTNRSASKETFSTIGQKESHSWRGLCKGQPWNYRSRWLMPNWTNEETILQNWNAVFYSLLFSTWKQAYQTKDYLLPKRRVIWFHLNLQIC